MSKSKDKDLKWGFSTGACATALALAAWNYEQNKQVLPDIDLLFLDDQKKTLPLLPPDFKNPHYLNQCSDSEKTIPPLFYIQKDGGDDPDCTHQAIIFGFLEKIEVENNSNSESLAEYAAKFADPADYILNIGNDILILHAISGIGKSTRLGLDCDKGHYAINHGPRKLLTLNLENAGMGKKDKSCLWRFSLGVERGEELAQKTLNPHLGIIGGISILGTTGHVKPYSHDAYIESVRICVRSNFLSNCNEMLFCTGGRTQKAAKKFYSHLPETAFVSIGDFIAESLKSAIKYQMHKVTVACMAGKLCKYAAKFEYTHAHNVAQDMQLLRQEILSALNKGQDLTMSNQLSQEVEKSNSVREALMYLPENIRKAVLGELLQKALSFFKSFDLNIDFGILLCDFNGDVIIEKRIKDLEK